MPGLTITLEPSAGEDSEFYVGETKVTLGKVVDSHNFQLHVEGRALNRIVNVEGYRPVQILPNVTVSAGDNTMGLQVKVCVQAPKSIRILRGRLHNG